MLTMTQTLDRNDTTSTDSDSFDLTQMTFETFAEVIFISHNCEIKNNHNLPYLTHRWKT